MNEPATSPRDEGSVASEDSGSAPEPDWKRKRRLAEAFGDVLPDTTRDERDPGGGSPRESANDAWLREQVPPHHGGH